MRHLEGLLQRVWRGREKAKGGAAQVAELSKGHLPGHLRRSGSEPFPLGADLGPGESHGVLWDLEATRGKRVRV
jgi:hypothetical protein